MLLGDVKAFLPVRETLTLMLGARGDFPCGILLFSQNLCSDEHDSTRSICHEYVSTLPECGVFCVLWGRNCFLSYLPASRRVICLSFVGGDYPPNSAMAR